MTLGEPRTAPDESTVITLCGSMRFREEFERLGAELTLTWHVVLTPTALDLSTELNAEERARLGRVHLQKIAMADEVLIVNVGDYVGESTRREVEYARSRGVAVSYLEPHAPDCHAENWQQYLANNPNGDNCHLWASVGIGTLHRADVRRVITCSGGEQHDHEAQQAAGGAAAREERRAAATRAESQDGGLSS